MCLRKVSAKSETGWLRKSQLFKINNSSHNPDAEEVGPRTIKKCSGNFSKFTEKQWPVTSNYFLIELQVYSFPYVLWKFSCHLFGRTPVIACICERNAQQSSDLCSTIRDIIIVNQDQHLINFELFILIKITSMKFSQLTFTCLKSIVGTREKGVTLCSKLMIKTAKRYQNAQWFARNSAITERFQDVVLVTLLLTLNIVHTLF